MIMVMEILAKSVGTMSVIIIKWHMGNEIQGWIQRVLGVRIGGGGAGANLQRAEKCALVQRLSTCTKQFICA